MLPALLLAVLSQTYQPIPQPWEDGQRLSPVVGLLALDRGGSADYGPGIPAPTVDCAPLPGSVDGDLVCSGANPTKAGNPTTVRGPFWRRGETDVLPVVRLDGTGDWYSFTAGAAGSAGFSAVVLFRATTLSGFGAIVTVDGGSSQRQWTIYRNTGSGDIILTVFKDDSTSTSLAIGTVTLNAWNVLAVSYDPAGGDNAAVLRASLNGAAPAAVTNGRAPLNTVTSYLRIGSRGDDAIPFVGEIRRVSAFNGFAASAAQLAQMVASQWGLMADKPSTAYATHARTDSTLSCPFSDQECFWVGSGAPAVHAPTYAGWASGGAVAGGIEVYGPGANAFSVSAAPVCSVNTACDRSTLEANSASCPMSPVAGTRMTLLTMNAAGAGVYSAPTGTMRSAWFATATGDSDCTVDFNEYAGTDAHSVSVTSTPVRWYRYKSTGSGFWIERTGTCARICFWEMQVTPTTYPVPLRSTTGIAYAGTASTATTLTVPVALTDPARWAISFTGTKSAASSSDDAYAFALGAGATNWAYMHGGFFGVLDASGAQTYVPVTGGIPLGANAIIASYTAQTLGLTINGASRAGTQTTAGVGLSPMPTTLYVGNHYVATAKAWGGLVSRVAQCNRGCR